MAHGNRFYLVSFSDLDIQQDIDFNLPKGCTVNAVFQSNTGRNFLWYNNISCIQFDMNDCQVLNRGLIKDVFPRVPGDISPVFRYIDERNIYYKYIEFKKELYAFKYYFA